MNRWVLVIRMLLAVLFVSAGIAKVGDTAGLIEALRRFDLFPGVSLVGIARYVPWFEIVAGIALVTPWFYRGAVWLLRGFMLLATAALVQAYFRGLNVNCGCWGSWWEMSLETAMVRNAVILVLLYAIRGNRRASR